jgi:hypothetical protein
MFFITNIMLGCSPEQANFFFKCSMPKVGDSVADNSWTLLMLQSCIFLRVPQSFTNNKVQRADLCMHTGMRKTILGELKINARTAQSQQVYLLS